MATQPQHRRDVGHARGKWDGLLGEEDARRGAGLSVASVAMPDVLPGSGTATDLPAARLTQALRDLGLDEDAAQEWTRVHVAQVTAEGTEADGVRAPATGLEVAHAVRAVAAVQARLDAVSLVLTQDLVLRSAEKLLARDGVEDPTALSRTAHQTWRSQVKASVAGELQVANGVGVVEARQMVAIASVPGAVRGHVLGSLRRGESCWRLVRAFQARTGRLGIEQAARVAESLFGTDVDVAAVERLDADGELALSRPWAHKEYYAALDREVVRAKDEDTAEEDREQAIAARSTSLTVEDDGASTFTCTTSIAAGVAISERIDGAARRARKGGDKRTLAQLRSDITAALLIYGTVPALEGDDASDPVVTPDDIDSLRAIISATPPGRVDLVVPWDAVLGAVCPTCRASGRTGPAPTTPAAAAATSESAPGPRERSAATSPWTTGPAPEPEEAPPATTHARWHPSAAPPDEESVDSNAIGELISWSSAFIRAKDARAIVLTPGTLLSRVLTNPADGRCIERATKSYAPDADMKRQVRAADVFGRGPGCRRPAKDCEIDHEEEFLTSGWTAEPNLNCKALLDHFRKTTRLMRSVMNERRDVTWTTLLGQVAVTRGHDYRQYLARVETLTPIDYRPAAGGEDGGVGGREGGAEPQDRADLAARRDLLNQVLYAAIVHRRSGERLEAEDDLPGSEDWLTAWDSIGITYRDGDGRRRAGGPPSHPTPEQLLGPAPTPAHAPMAAMQAETEGESADRDIEPPPF